MKQAIAISVALIFTASEANAIQIAPECQKIERPDRMHLRRPEWRRHQSAKGWR
jgi:hypothetical protein